MSNEVQNLDVIQDIITIAKNDGEIKLRKVVDDFNEAQNALVKSVNSMNDIVNYPIEVLRMIVPITMAQSMNGEDFNTLFGPDIISKYGLTLRAINAFYMTDTLRIASAICRYQNSKKEAGQLVFVLGKDPLRKGSKLVKGIYSVSNVEEFIDKYKEDKERQLPSESILQQVGMKKGNNFTELYWDPLEYNSKTKIYAQLDLSNLLNTFLILSFNSIEKFTDEKENFKYPNMEIYTVKDLDSNVVDNWTKLFDVKEMHEITSKCVTLVEELFKKHNL